LQLVLNNHLVLGPKYLIAGLECVLLVGLFTTRPKDELNPKPSHRSIRRALSLVMIAFITIANISSLVLVINYLLNTHYHLEGRELIVSAIAIYITNIIIFGLWYWELDGSGPGGRGTHLPPVDFLFVQMSTPESITKTTNWSPTFIDYLYVSITNASAFSPTDALPLTHRTKMLMSVQSFVSLATIAVVAARAVNVLH
jgi:hypothetical protein